MTAFAEGHVFCTLRSLKGIFVQLFQCQCLLVKPHPLFCVHIRNFQHQK